MYCFLQNFVFKPKVSNVFLKDKAKWILPLSNCDDKSIHIEFNYLYQINIMLVTESCKQFINA